MTLPVMTAETLSPPTGPTLYFIGVSTGQSSIQEVFPRWAKRLGLARARLQGIDLPLHASKSAYRSVVEFIKCNPLALGALVTTHKLDLFEAAGNLFDVVDHFAQLMGETSCISKRKGHLVSHAKDPISSGLALDSFVPIDHWRETGGHAFLMGAGGSTIAISWHLSQHLEKTDRPETVIISNRSQPRLDHLRSIQEKYDSPPQFKYVLAATQEDNDRILEALPPASLVVNATGLGKDAPGSPLSNDTVFPSKGFIWELNYRGNIVFLDQARKHQGSLQHIEDGWNYFLHGWTRVISEVFDIDIPTEGPLFEELSALAKEAR